MATKVNTTETVEKKTKAVEETVQTEPKDEYVTVRLPQDRNTKEDKVVWVNDKRYIIKRGVTVDVPACVAEQLAHEERMLEERYAFEAKMQR